MSFCPSPAFFLLLSLQRWMVGVEEKREEITDQVMQQNSKVYVSFGGLLLYLEGPYKKLTPLRIDYVYLLIKK